MGLPRIFRNVYELRRMRRLSLESILRIQQGRFLRLLKYAKKYSPFYANLYRDINIDSHLQIENLPLIDKRTLMDNFDSIITVKNITKQKVLDFIKNEKTLKKLNTKFTVTHSGGSSGFLWISVFDDYCFDYEIACIIEDENLNLIGRVFKKPIRIAAVATENLHVGSTVFYKNVPKFLANIKHFSVRKPVSEIVKGLNEFNPEVIGGYPLILKELAEQKMRGALHIHPKKIFSSGFLLTEEAKNAIIKAFNCNPYDSYSAAEATGPIATTECEYHSRHVYLNSVILEVLDTNDNPVQPAKPGKAVITNLMKFTQPIIRYRLNDIVQMSDKKCLCGCPWPVIEKIWGREGDIIWIKKSGEDYEIIDPILFYLKIPNLEKLQVIQEGYDYLRVKIVVNEKEEEVTKQVEEAIGNILRDKGLYQIVKVKVEVVLDIPLVLNIHKMVISKLKSR